MLPNPFSPFRVVFLTFLYTPFCVNILEHKRILGFFPTSQERSCDKRILGTIIPKGFSLVQDGFYCKKHCHPTDVLCIANHTLSISYQYATLPSLKRVPEPMEVTNVRAESLDGREFYVEYVMDSANRDKFRVQQEKNIGIVQLIAPIRGRRTVVIRLHMNVYSTNRVMIGHNLALIRVYVSEYYF